MKSSSRHPPANGANACGIGNLVTWLKDGRLVLNLRNARTLSDLRTRQPTSFDGSDGSGGVTGIERDQGTTTGL
jgi:hypothetical protein